MARTKAKAARRRAAQPKAETERPSESVASQAENRKLEHTEGGATTRDDLTDLGVPMLPGDPDEPVGPEDALGPGPKRGDYSDRVGPAVGLAPSHQVVPVDDTPRRGARSAEDETPTAKAVNQNKRASDRGEAKGLKGGVDTAERG